MLDFFHSNAERIMLEYTQRFLDGSTRTLYVDVWDDGSFSVWGNPLKVGRTLESTHADTYKGSNLTLLLDITQWLKQSSINK